MLVIVRVLKVGDCHICVHVALVDDFVNKCAIIHS